MVKRNAALLAPMAIAAAALPGVWVASASATGASSGGVVHFYQVDDSASSISPGGPEPLCPPGSCGLVTISGAIDDSGVDDENMGGSTINVIDLQNGTFEVNVANFGTGPMQLHVNDTNCSYEAVTAGTVPIVPGSGTGSYIGIRGTFYVVGTFVGTFPPSTGANGPCDTSQPGSAVDDSVGDIIEATAYVSFSG